MTPTRYGRTVIEICGESREYTTELSKLVFDYRYKVHNATNHGTSNVGRGNIGESLQQ
jgi:hypothetical protein